MGKVTRWFPADVKPVRVGFYDVIHTPDGDRIGEMRYWWNGEFWSNRRGGLPSITQDKQWRGLARLPSGEKS